MLSSLLKKSFVAPLAIFVSATAWSFAATPGSNPPATDLTTVRVRAGGGDAEALNTLGDA